MIHNHLLELNGNPIDCVGDEARPVGPGNFHLCWQVDTYEHFAEALGLPERKTATGPCLFLGDRIYGLDKPCDSCGGKATFTTHECAVHGQCTPTFPKTLNGLKACSGCTEKAASSITIDSRKLAPSPDGSHFNASMIRYKGRLLMAYRVGRGGSNIYIAELGEDLVPTANTFIELHHQESGWGREDPRLFVHRDRLHLCFGGVVGDPGNGRPGHCSILYAELGDDLTVQNLYCPWYSGRHPTWEKNWSMFSHDGELFAVYSISPHVVLRIEGEQATEAARSEVEFPWQGGAMRGGAPPVRVGDEYWGWFHGSVDAGGATPNGPAAVRIYNIGVYAFEAEWPFRPTRIVPAPVMWASGRTVAPVTWCSALFPCGAVLENGVWQVSAGMYDKHVAVHKFLHANIERRMEEF